MPAPARAQRHGRHHVARRPTRPPWHGRGFLRLKRVVGGWIDTTLDHTMLLHKNDPVLPLLREKGERVLVLDVNPTAENIAKLIYDFAASQGFPVD